MQQNLFQQKVFINCIAIFLLQLWLSLTVFNMKFLEYRYCSRHVFGNTFWLLQELCKQFQGWTIVEKRRPSFSANASTPKDRMELNSIKQIRLQKLFQTDINTRLRLTNIHLIFVEVSREGERCLTEGVCCVSSGTFGFWEYTYMVTWKEENYMLEVPHLKSIYLLVLALLLDD